jgi:hypothetical protein
MVGRVRYTGELLVAFMRPGEPIERVVAENGVRAWEHAVGMISRRDVLQHGDILTVRRNDLPLTQPEEED